jgi:cytochrome c biogenesis DsbD-like protein
MRKSFGSLCALLAVSLCSAGARGAEKPDVGATVALPARLAAGSKTTVVVEMAIGPGWHVNSHTPSDKFLIPTDVALVTTAGALSAFRYPKDVAKTFSFSDKPLKIYEGTVRFEADLDLPAAASGEVSVHGSLTYQACNDRQCFAPAKISLEATAAVSGANAAR